MGKYYVFAIFIFMLCLLFVFLIKFFSVKKEKAQDYNGNDEKLLRLYQQIEDMLESFEEYVIEVKQEITDEKDSVRQYMTDAQKQIDDKLKSIEQSDDKNHSEKIVSAKPDKKEPNQTEKLGKSELVKKLYHEGMEVNEIAKKLNITTSEIKLIIDVNI